MADDKLPSDVMLKGRDVIQDAYTAIDQLRASPAQVDMFVSMGKHLADLNSQLKAAVPSDPDGAKKAYIDYGVRAANAMLIYKTKIDADPALLDDFDRQLLRDAASGKVGVEKAPVNETPTPALPKDVLDHGAQVVQQTYAAGYEKRASDAQIDMLVTMGKHFAESRTQTTVPTDPKAAKETYIDFGLRQSLVILNKVKTDVNYLDNWEKQLLHDAADGKIGAESTNTQKPRAELHLDGKGGHEVNRAALGDLKTQYTIPEHAPAQTAKASPKADVKVDHAVIASAAMKRRSPTNSV